MIKITHSSAKISKTLLLIIAVVAMVTGSLPVVTSAVTADQWDAGRIIDDDKFTDADAMSINEVQAFLNSKVPECDILGAQPVSSGSQTRAEWAAANGKQAPPYTCLRDFHEIPKTSPSPGIPANNYGSTDPLNPANIPAGAKSAANLIWDAAQEYSISPKVLLTTIQKESYGPLIEDDWPYEWFYTYALGAYCPDSGPESSANCDENYAGFSIQIRESARLFRYYLDNMNKSWWPYKKPFQKNTILYQVASQPQCGSSKVFIGSMATAALYTYTPYQPNEAALANLYGSGDSCSAYGNRNFWRIYNDWFGPSTGSYCGVKTINTIKSDVVYGRVSQNIDNANFILYSGTSTNCIEAHSWSSGYRSWDGHIASNMEAVPVPDSEVMYGDLNGDGIDEPILVGYRKTGSGNVEFHVWDTSMQNWQLHAASNQIAVDPYNSNIMFADTNGDGIDEPILVGYRKTGSGNVEFHVWESNLGQWRSHHASNQQGINPTNSRITFADTNGDGADEAVLIGLRGTGSGNIEFHVWEPGMGTWLSHHASNQAVIDPANSKVLFADTNGDGIDEAILIGLKGTGSGKVEFHTWEPGMSAWLSHQASNQLAL
jgi:hypothetical protein